MKKIRSMSGFIHPFHFNRNHLVGNMKEKGIVEVDSERYAISPSSFFTTEPVHLYLIQDKYETETEYMARLEKEKEEREADLKLQAELLEQKKQRAIEQQNLLEKEFEEFKSKYKIPFKHSMRIKPVLSGLSENSMGNGAKRNTVIHLFVEEKVSGRLKREADSFLCSPKDIGKWTYLGEDTHQTPVTCKKCLSLMERWLVNKR